MIKMVCMKVCVLFVLLSVIQLSVSDENDQIIFPIKGNKINKEQLEKIDTEKHVDENKKETSVEETKENSKNGDSKEKVEIVEKHKNQEELQSNVKVHIKKDVNECGLQRHTINMEIPKPPFKYNINIQQKITTDNVIVNTILTEINDKKCEINEVAEENGYFLYPGIGIYKKHIPANWTEAKKTCESEGAHLAIINSVKEADLLLRLFNTTPSHGIVVCYDSLWVGLSDIETEGKFVTIFGDPLETTGFRYWPAGEPNGARGENCGTLHYNKWLNDCPCHVTATYFCQKKMK